MTKLTLKKARKILSSIRDKIEIDVTISLLITCDSILNYKIEIPEIGEYAEVEYDDENAILDYLNDLNSRL
jgi:hypothetical protein